MARLYADENFTLGVVRELRRLGHDVLRAQEVGQANRGIPDDQVLAFGTGDGRAVLTHNRRDFFALHRRGVRHAGIIACTDDADWVGQAGRIDAILRSNPNQAGLELRVYKPSK